MTKYAKRIDKADNVATVVANCRAGDEIAVKFHGYDQNYVCNHEVPFGHKIALADIPEGEAVIKYGETIGSATCNIEKGDWVHTHNVKDDYQCLDKQGRPLPGQKPG